MQAIIETKRLIIRELITTDEEGIFLLDSNPIVHTYLGKQPITTREQAAAAINFIRGQYAELGIGRWAVIEKKAEIFMGWCGFKYVTSETNHHKNYYDIGYRFRQEFWGRGYATEAARACLDYGFTNLAYPKVFAMAEKENIGSNKILVKIGMQLTECFNDNGVPTNWYQSTKEQYAKQIST